VCGYSPSSLSSALQLLIDQLLIGLLNHISLTKISKLIKDIRSKIPDDNQRKDALRICSAEYHNDDRSIKNVPLIMLPLLAYKYQNHSYPHRLTTELIDLGVPIYNVTCSYATSMWSLLLYSWNRQVYDVSKGIIANKLKALQIPLVNNPTLSHQHQQQHHDDSDPATNSDDIAKFIIDHPDYDHTSLLEKVRCASHAREDDLKSTLVWLCSHGCNPHEMDEPWNHDLSHQQIKAQLWRRQIWNDSSPIIDIPSLPITTAMRASLINMPKCDIRDTNNRWLSGIIMGRRGDINDNNGKLLVYSEVNSMDWISIYSPRLSLTGTRPYAIHRRLDFHMSPVVGGSPYERALKKQPSLAAAMNQGWLIWCRKRDTFMTQIRDACGHHCHIIEPLLHLILLYYGASLY
jgi:hypothetical protein